MRRTAEITATYPDSPGVVEQHTFCYPECMAIIFRDDGVPHPGRNGGPWPRKGEVTYLIKWSNRIRKVKWYRARPNGRWCHLCGDAWAEVKIESSESHVELELVVE